MKFRLALGVLLTASACADKVTTPSNPPPNPSPSDPAVVVSYLDELTRIMRTEAANAAGIDWDRFRAELAAAAADAQTISAAYPAIELALRLLGDFESHYVAATGRLIGPSPEPACTRSPARSPAAPRHHRLRQSRRMPLRGCRRECVCRGPADRHPKGGSARAHRMDCRPQGGRRRQHVADDSGPGADPRRRHHGVDRLQQPGVRARVPRRRGDEPRRTVRVRRTPICVGEERPQSRRAHGRRDQQRRRSHHRLVQGSARHAIVRHGHVRASSSARVVSHERRRSAHPQDGA